MKPTKPLKFDTSEIPQDVMWVGAIQYTGHPVGVETMKRIDAIITKYPKWFPWETKYRSIPKDVHDAYSAEAFPKEDWFSKSKERNEGILQQIRQVQPYIKPTGEEIIRFFARLRNDDSERQAELKRIWDKHYSKYGLPFRSN